MQEELICKSEKTQLKKYIITTIITVIVLTASVILAINIKFYDKPKPDKTAQEGVPTVEEKYEYSTLEINDGYEIGLCGKPNITNNQIELYFTNMEKNDVWIKVQILDSENKVIGETGIIEPNKYVKSIELNENIEGKINIKVIEYEIDTYNSKGNVNLKL